GIYKNITLIYLFTLASAGYWINQHAWERYIKYVPMKYLDWELMIMAYLYQSKSLVSANGYMQKILRSICSFLKSIKQKVLPLITYMVQPTPLSGSNSAIKSL